MRSSQSRRRLRQWSASTQQQVSSSPDPDGTPRCGQHKQAPGILARARRFPAEGGFAVVAIDVPNHGERPTGEEFDRIVAEYGVRMATGEDTAALDTATYTPVVGQAVAERARANRSVNPSDQHR